MPDRPGVPREKLAWVAAVLDMKGTIIYKANQTRATPQIVLMVESTHVSVVEELARLTGSVIEPRESRLRPAWMRRGCITHCPEPDVEYPEQPDHLPAQSRWTVTGAAAAVILYSVIPYMVTDKGMQAALDEILGFVNLAGRSGNSARQAVTRLHDHGWRLPPTIDRQADALGLFGRSVTA
jgi:hypothetical protein